MCPASAPLADQYRSAMRRLASTVSVVTCSQGQQWHGMTATAVTSVCAEPATILVCINQSASLHEPLRAGGRFCVNLLSACQTEVAQAFSGMRKGAERFTVGHWVSGEQGLPALRGAQASLFCTVVETLGHGTHSVFLGRVDAISSVDGISPLIYQDGSYSCATRLVPEAACA